MRRIVRIIFQSGRVLYKRASRITLPGRCSSASIQHALMIREASVEMAAPTTPSPNPKIKIALPAILNRLLHPDTIIGVLAFPSARQSAAPPLNSPING